MRSQLVGPASYNNSSFKPSYGCNPVLPDPKNQKQDGKTSPSLLRWQRKLEQTTAVDFDELVGEFFFFDTLDNKPQGLNEKKNNEPIVLM